MRILLSGLGVDSWRVPSPGINPARALTVSQFLATGCDITVSANGQAVAARGYNRFAFLLHAQPGTLRGEHRPDTAMICKVQASFASEFLKSVSIAHNIRPSRRRGLCRRPASITPSGIVIASRLPQFP